VGCSAFAALLAGTLAFADVAPPARTAEPATHRDDDRHHESPITRQFKRAERLSGGRLGIAALHLGSGEGVGYRATERFPMASTFKLPVALHVLRLVERGELRLDRRVTVTRADRVAGAGPLDRATGIDATTLTVDSLLAAMVLDSDNTAADKLLELTGGPPAVTARVRALGVTGLDVDRTERELHRDLALDRAAFAADPRDTSTPDAMLALLRRFALGEALDRDGSEKLRGLLERSPIGPRRLRAGAPAAAVVAHKTGTMPGSANDVGIISLPEGRGRLAIAVFVKDSNAPLERRERAIAEATRIACSVFMAAEPAPKSP
jgi:beta-lactamase class A